MQQISDHTFSAKLDSKYGVDLKYINNDEEFVTVCDDTESRKVMLDITSWKGRTLGAMHFYGEIKIASLKAKSLRTGKVGYLSPVAPAQAKGVTVSLTRTVTKKDLLMDNGKRFNGAELGERIKNFDSEKDVKMAAVHFFKKHFKQGWKLVLLTPDLSSAINGTVVFNKETVLSH
jgi:hypothetical protein